MSLYRQRLLLAFAVIGAFLIAGLLGSIAGIRGDYWDWEGSGSFFATFAAVQVTYFAAPRYRLLLACGVLAVGAIFSRAIFEYFGNFFGYWDTSTQPSMHHYFRGGVTGLFMALLIMRCSTLNLSTFRQWLLAALTVVGAFLTAAVLTATVLRSAFSVQMVYWNQVPIFCATLGAVLVTYFAVPRYRIFLASSVLAVFVIVFGTLSKGTFHLLGFAIASGGGGIIGLFVAFLVDRRHVSSISRFRVWFLGALAVIGGFIVAVFVAFLLGHGGYRDAIFWGTLAAVLVTYFSVSRYGFVLAFCTFVLGALFSWYVLDPSRNFYLDAPSTYGLPIANCMGGLTGLFLIAVAKDCSTSDVSAFRQRLLVAFAVIGVFVASGIFGSIAANRLGYWDLPSRPANFY